MMRLAEFTQRLRNRYALVKMENITINGQDCYRYDICNGMQSFRAIIHPSQLVNPGEAENILKTIKEHLSCVVQLH